MNTMQKIAKRNNIQAVSKRCTISEMISESYKVLYECEVGTPLYRLAENHISNVKSNFEDMPTLTKDLSVLRGLVALGESAKVYESDIIPEDTQDFADEMKLNKKNLGNDEDVEELDDADVINEEEEVDLGDVDELDDRDVINEEDSDLEDEEIIEEDEEEVIEEDEEEESEDDQITPEELNELKKHLREIRKARRVKESKKVRRAPVRESRNWCDEATAMRAALKHFRESSTNKAFYNTFSKMNGRLGQKKPLTLQESILLYKATNSAMTQLAVELEHNPEFIYTFRECTSILSEDTKKLLECIRKHESPSASLVKSLRTFSNILLESDDLKDEYEDEETLINEDDAEPIVAPEEELEEDEESVEDIPAEEDIVEESEEEEIIEEEDEIPEEEEEVLEEEDEESVEDEELLEEDDEEEESPIVAPEEEEAEITEDDVDPEMDAEISDEEAELLKQKLEEIRNSRKLKESKKRSSRRK